VAIELHDEGRIVNHKKVMRLTKENDLTCGRCRPRSQWTVLGFEVEVAVEYSAMSVGTPAACRCQPRPSSSTPKRLRRATNLGCDRHDRRPSRWMLGLMIQNHPNRTNPDLERKFVDGLLRHGSILSRVGASGKSRFR
jgi:hypothetical protein